MTYTEALRQYGARATQTKPANADVPYNGCTACCYNPRIDRSKEPPERPEHPTTAICWRWSASAALIRTLPESYQLSLSISGVGLRMSFSYRRPLAQFFDALCHRSLLDRVKFVSGRRTMWPQDKQTNIGRVLRRLAGVYIKELHPA
jgi:hypothetical protein